MSDRIQPKNKIVNDAEDMLGESNYGLLTDNCQHFCTKCRYGTARSIEVNNAVATLSITAGILEGIAILMTVIRVFLRRKAKKNKN